MPRGEGEAPSGRPSGPMMGGGRDGVYWRTSCFVEDFGLIDSSIACALFFLSCSFWFFADVSQRVMKIFVGGLSPEVTDASFREYFSKFGTITDSTVFFIVLCLLCAAGFISAFLFLAVTNSTLFPPNPFKHVFFL